jgi:putative restriction endonuclease
MANWEYAAGKVWPVLTDAARESRLVTYGDIAPTIPTNPLSVGRALGPIQSFCLENRLPPLTAIVVGKNTKVPGDGFIAWDVDDLESAHKKVFDYDWSLVKNPYHSFGPTDTVEILGEALANQPAQGEEIFRRVNDRGIFQKIFRIALLKLYGKCSMCGLTFEDALEAAHIVPWSKCTVAERSDVTNGMLLCATHHKLFDSGWMTISDAYKIEYSDMEMQLGPYSASDTSLTTELHDKLLHLPEGQENWPAISYFMKRRAIDSDDYSQ